MKTQRIRRTTFLRSPEMESRWTRALFRQGYGETSPEALRAKAGRLESPPDRGGQDLAI